MTNQWTMAAFLAEHDKKWEAEIARLKSLNAQLEFDNHYWEKAYNTMVDAFNELAANCEDSGTN